MNTEYDVIVLGTGLKECMLAGLLAKFPIPNPQYFNNIKYI
jgi:hypothetical protein